MSRRKAKTAEVTAAFAEAGIGDARQSDCTIFESALQYPLTRRRLDPRIGALAKLDIVEHRLHVANTSGDMDGWSRYYLAWIALHRVAFGGGEL